MRYNLLTSLIGHHKPSCIVEVGTWNGLRAIMMATEALKHQKKIQYIGFDLFEDASEETDERENNVKVHHTEAEVRLRLEEFKKNNEGFSYELRKGDTRETLKECTGADFAFIDGGHSIETIQNDFNALKGTPVIVLDDYYSGGPDIEKYGCNKVLKDVDHVVLPSKDPVKGGGKVQMALVPRSAWPGKQNLVVKTKNCVPNEEIATNIRYSLEKFDRYIAECETHSETAVIVSGGPSLESHMDEIREEKGWVVCVKHSHDKLIKEGIIPWACMLLDPRDHVQDFIENPHPDILYFCATMCHPTTIDRLIERDANIWAYNAHVGAGEEKILPKGHIMVGGGSTSAVRGISVLHTLGFRHFKLYGFDSCYEGPMDTEVKDKLGRQRYFEVEVNGRKFWSDAELIAQAQDFDKLMKVGHELKIECVGDGMIPHIWSVMHRNLPNFQELLNG